MRVSGRNGFTLLELLVVIAIAGFLAAALVVSCVGLTRGAKIEATRSLVRALDAGCHSYQTRFGSPPGAPSTVSSTTILYQALCVPLVATEGGTGPGGKKRTLAPFCELPHGRLTCAPQIHDDWGWPVRYSFPGTAHGADGVDCTKTWDIDASSTDGGLIGNWNAAR